MNTLSRLFLTAMLLCTTALGLVKPVRAEPFRYSLLLQRETGVQSGFKLYLEDAASTEHLEDLQLNLSVADGQSWRTTTAKHAWQWEQEYRVKASIGPKSASVWLDGQMVSQSPGNFSSNNAQPLKAGLEVRSPAATDYLIQQTSLTLSTNKGQRRQFAFPAPPQNGALALFAFEPQTPIVAPWKLGANETLTIETTFRILHTPDLQSLSPAIDLYGQSLHADWPGKIHNDTEFRQAISDENRRQTAWGLPAGYDAYGGTKNLGWNVTPTGFFRTERRNGYWWLITPEGNPCFYLGVDTVTGISEKTLVSGRESLFTGLPPSQGEYAGAWSEDSKADGSTARAFGFSAANLIRKYGANWQTSAWQDAGKRLKTWGFSGYGKWSGVTNADSPAPMPVQPVLRRTGVPTLGRLPDTFDPAVRATFRAVLEKGILPNKDNPYVLGWSVQNEHDEIVLKSDIVSILQRPITVPAKRAVVDFALEHVYGGDAKRMATAWKIALPTNETPETLRQSLEGATPQPPGEDIEALRCYYANDYYSFIYRTIKEIDPNHLYFGFWISPGWWENEEDWRLSARNCDVVGFDRYDYNFLDERMSRLMQESDKPVLCGEFSYPAYYGGQRGYGVFGTSLYGVWTADDAASGDAYARWVNDAARNPYCVGMHWFQYRDQPLTGRNTNGTRLVNGEHYAFGLVDMTDRPKWDLIERMRRANLNAANERLSASKKASKR